MPQLTDSIISGLDKTGTLALSEIAQCASLSSLEDLRVKLLGKKGSISECLKALGQVDAADRPKLGALANSWKTKIEETLATKKSELTQLALDQQIASENIDVTLPSRMPSRGSLHPVTLATRRLIEVFSKLGFDVTTGPEIETDFLNFEAVNIPKDHPARDMQDTFFMGPGVVLRTHTSAVQMRELLSRPWPVRILCPGAVYRCDHDATHSPMFHQIEGLWVDRGVKMSDLKGVLEYFAREVFGAETQIRLRPSFFPFVEPGAEVDISCFRCRKKKQDDCKICRGSGWLEILGAGMVHPELLKTAGYNPDEVSGFAFGMGVDRIAMLLHEIPDLRLMFSGDTRFLGQWS